MLEDGDVVGVGSNGRDDISGAKRWGMWPLRFRRVEVMVFVARSGGNFGRCDFGKRRTEWRLGREVENNGYCGFWESDTGWRNGDCGGKRNGGCGLVGGLGMGRERCRI